MGSTARLRWSLGVALAALIVLGLHALPFEPNELHVQGPFVDQAGYITTARHLVDEGELRCGLIYPAHVRDPRWRPYMPGHYLALAASYALLGFGSLASLLPSIAAYVLATVGVFLLGERLYGRTVGLVSACLYALFLGNITYALTAMAEMTFAAASVWAVLAFVHVPPRWRPFAAPLLLAIPFLFRETGALLVFPMGALLLWDGGTRPWKRLTIALLASVALLFLLNVWQIRAGKGSVPLSWVTDNEFNYTNAYRESSTLDPAEWVAACARNARRNLHVLGRYAREDLFQIRVLGFGTIVAAIAWALASGFPRRRQDPLSLGAGVLGIVLLGMIFFLYDVKGQKGMRSALFTVPLLAAVVARPLTSLTASRFARGVLLLTAIPLIWMQATLTASSARELTAGDEVVAETTAAIRALDHDPATLLLVAFDLFPFALDYAVREYPVPWSFMPSNEETLKLVQERYRVGTALINAEALGELQRPATIHGGELRFQRELALGRHTYLVYQRP